MYNRYIPNGQAYTRVSEEDAPPFTHPATPSRRTEPRPDGHGNQQRHEAPPHQTHPFQPRQEPPHAPEPPPLFHTPTSEKPSILSGLLARFHLEDLDTGDILLLLILLFLVLDGDGDNVELIIALGLMILFSLGDKEKAKDEEEDQTAPV